MIEVNVCAFFIRSILSFEKIPKDIPLFAYINKAANSFRHRARSTIESEGRDTVKLKRNWIELNGIDQE